MPIAAIIPFIPQLIAAGKDLWQFVAQVRTAAKQTGEWTPELESQFLDALIAANDSEYSKPENWPQSK